MLAGASTFAAIGDWATDLDEAAHHRLGFVGRIPAGSRVWRFLVRIDAQVLQAVLTSRLRHRLPARPARGARTGWSSRWTASCCAGHGCRIAGRRTCSRHRHRHRHRRRPGPGRHRGEIERDPRLHPTAGPDSGPARLARWHHHRGGCVARPGRPRPRRARPRWAVDGHCEGQPTPGTAMFLGETRRCRPACVPAVPTARAFIHGE